MAKRLPSVNLQYSKIEKQKNGQVARRGPLTKRGTLLKLSALLSQLKGDPLEKKQSLEKKVSQCQKTERGDPLGFFNIHSVAKHQKIEGGFFLFSEKISQCRKN